MASAATGRMPVPLSAAADAAAPTSSGDLAPLEGPADAAGSTGVRGAGDTGATEGTGAAGDGLPAICVIALSRGPVGRVRIERVSDHLASGLASRHPVALLVVGGALDDEGEHLTLVQR
jgi:hypothetical protein